MPEERFSNALIDVISELTRMSIMIHFSKLNRTLRDKSFPEFCQNVENIVPSGCNCEFNSGTELHMCEAGLWCRAFPVCSREEDIGRIIIGYRRINGKDNESRNKLKEFADKYGLNRFDAIKLYSAFENIPLMNEKDFYNSLFAKVYLLEEYVLEENKRAEVQKEYAEETRNRSIRAAHELQIPIQSMVGITEYLCGCIKNDIPNASCRGRPISSIAYELLEKLIKFSYMADNLRAFDDQKTRYDFEKTNYINLLQETINLFREEGVKKGITIRDIEFINHPPNEIDASEHHLKQLFFNIIHNAIKYSYAPTKENKRFINVVCIGYPNRVEIKVSNYGIGILESELKENLIFMKGYRGELSVDRNRIGSGLGLWMAKRIVEDHHGEIKVESKKVGEGIKVDPYLTTVSICLPAKQPKDLAAICG